MKRIVISVLIASVTSAFGSLKPDYVLADLEPLPLAEYTVLPGPGGPVSPKATLEVTYWIQPCANQRFEQFVVTRSGETGDRQMRVGVLIYDSGIQCAGPTVKETKTLKFEGAFNLPGEQPTIKELRFLNQ
jgi:hypothetical protein